MESTTIGQNVPLPVHKVMESSKLLEHLASGLIREMVGVRQENLAFEVLHLLRSEAFDRAFRTDWHIDWCLNGSMGKDDIGCPG